MEPIRSYVLLSGLGMLSPPSTFTPMGIVVDGVLNLLNMILQGLFDLIGYLFASGIRTMLFFESPYELAGPNQAFNYNLKFALALLPVIVAIGIFSMPFANRHKAATWRQVWRIIEVLIFIALARPALHVALVLVNTTGEYIFPHNYDLTFAGQGLYDSLFAIGVTGLGLVIGGFLLTSISVIGILFLFFILFLREFLFHLIYQGFPILIVAWYLDWGPFKTSNHIAVVVFRLTGYLVLVGPLIALALQVGAVLGGGSWPPDGSPPSDPKTTVDFWRQLAGWFMGIALASAFGAKAAMMGGVPMGQIGAAKGRSSKSSTSDSSGSSGSSDESANRGSLGGQMRDTIREADRRAPYSGTMSDRMADRVSNTKESMSTKWNEVSDRDDLAGSSARFLGAAGKTLGPKAKRAAADAYTGGKYAATHLHESPVDWGRAGTEHYRNNPVVSNQRRAKWLVDQQSTKSMRQDEIAEQMGWSETKTQQVVDGLKDRGQLEVFETDQGNIVMNPDRFSDRPSDQPTDRPLSSQDRRRAS